MGKEQGVVVAPALCCVPGMTSRRLLERLRIEED
jgi:hypothetical protein